MHMYVYPHALKYTCLSKLFYIGHYTVNDLKTSQYKTMNLKSVHRVTICV